jgi:hypothetical protein
MFRVEWLREAVGELAELWIEADSPFRRAITEATHALDQELQADPFRASESTEGEVRISFSNPLATGARPTRPGTADHGRVIRCISFNAQLGRTWKCRAVVCVYPRLVHGVIRTDM